uniref:Type IV toxin-antitoxin system AbiEi family antitoxin domain-containing protein n=1 Tax=Mycoplasma anserisalpingitidis TaxID=519450 RepID=A0A8F2IHY6_9MOLU|nr:hypothetical protein [Mycoplasma anserisalpingitidis]
MNYKKLIKDRIDSFHTNYVFIIRDFYDIAEYQTIKSTLNRLCKSEYIKRIMSGIYYKPKYFETLDTYNIPCPSKVAEAIARKFNWNIIPTGEASLNILGLSTQVSSEWIYASDGKNVDIKYGDILIKFKKIPNKDISNKYYLSALIIQALKTLGKENITEKQIEYLNKKFNQAEKQLILDECKTTDSWVYELIKLICIK